MQENINSNTEHLHWGHFGTVALCALVLVSISVFKSGFDVSVENITAALPSAGTVALKAVGQARSGSETNNFQLGAAPKSSTVLSVRTEESPASVPAAKVLGASTVNAGARLVSTRLVSALLDMLDNASNRKKSAGNAEAGEALMVSVPDVADPNFYVDTAKAGSRQVELRMDKIEAAGTGRNAAEEVPAAEVSLRSSNESSEAGSDREMETQKTGGLPVATEHALKVLSGYLSPYISS